MFCHEIDEKVLGIAKIHLNITVQRVNSQAVKKISKNIQRMKSRNYDIIDDK